MSSKIGIDKVNPNHIIHKKVGEAIGKIVKAFESECEITKTQGIIIISLDANCTPDPFIDRTDAHGNPDRLRIPLKHRQITVFTTIQRLGFIDSFRSLHKNSKSFTFSAFSAKKAKSLALSYTGAQSRLDQQWIKIINPPGTHPIQIPIIESGMIPEYLDSDHIPIGIMLTSNDLFKSKPNKAYMYKPIPITPLPPSEVLLNCPLTTPSRI